MVFDLKKYTAEDLILSYEVIFRQYLSAQMIDDKADSNPIFYLFGFLLEEIKDQYLRTDDGRLGIILKLEREILAELAAYLKFDDTTLLQMVENPDKQYKMFD